MKFTQKNDGLGWSITIGFEVGELISYSEYKLSNGEYKKVIINAVIKNIYAIPEGSRKVYIAEVLPFGESIAVKVGVFRLRKLKP